MSRPRFYFSPRRAAALVVVTVAIGAAVGALVASRKSQVEIDRSTVADPFHRSPRRTDRLPWELLRDEHVLATRRIAVYARRSRSAGLYLARTRRAGLCLVLVADRVAGASCNSSLARRPVALTVMYGLHYVSGVVRSDVRSLVIIGTRGRRHRIGVGTGGGFIYRCPAFAGCIASVRSIEAYNGAGRLVGGHSLPRA